MVNLAMVIAALLDDDADDACPNPLLAGWLHIASQPVVHGLGGLGVRDARQLARAVDRAAGAALPQAAPMLRLLADYGHHRLEDPAGVARYAELQAGLREAADGIPPERLDVDMNY